MKIKHVLLLLGFCAACDDSAAPATSSAMPPSSAVGGANASQPSSISTAGAMSPSSQNIPATQTGRDELQLPPLEPGFERFIASSIELPPGATNDWMQWVGGPLDQDYDVSEVRGAQSKTGHHAILYTTTEANPVGVTRLWSEKDQLTTQTVSGIGAEGAIPVPPGVVIRVKKGSYFVIESHYLNATDELRIGQTYMDVKFVPANPNAVLASRIANTSLKIALPPRQETVVDLMCKVDVELQLLRMTNHMHEYGVSTFTQFIDPAGKPQMIKKDDVWSEHWALAPNYLYYPLESPLIVPAGSTLHTQCKWNNTSDSVLQFPREMCAFSGLLLGSRDITCLDGKAQSAAGSSASSGPSASPGAVAGSAGSAGVAGNAGSAGVAGSAGSAGVAGSGGTAAVGACTGDSDRARLMSEDFKREFKNCGASCFGGSEMCATDCLLKQGTLSHSCAACNGTQITCAMTHCVLDCSGDVASAGCQSCIEENCGAVYHECAGV